METIIGGRSVGSSSVGKGKEISTKTGEANDPNGSSLLDRSLVAWLQRQKIKIKAENLLTKGVGLIQRVASKKKGNVCGDDMPMDNGENKEGNVEERCGVNTASDNLPQQICIEQDTRTLCVDQMTVDRGNNGEANKVASTGDMKVDAGDNMEDVSAEDEGDDTDYDFNAWHDYVQNDCVTDDDDDLEEGPGKGKSCGKSGGNGIGRSGAIGGRGSGKSASGRNQRSGGGGSKSNKNDSKRRRSKDITDGGSYYISSSRSYTGVTETEEGVDVVLVTPPKSKNQHTRVTEDNDDDDEFVDHPIPPATAFEDGEALRKARDNVSGTPPEVGSSHNQATEPV
ncbi:hypothetical protein Bca52824_023795 [Brassica carinata]|uniref:Uncharacterized protein n=1 Tax=Brassica carinata TaxID=52824 RepID=A0A8X7VJF0_BRACI|nr:hypothetical protein Bca52824_023795 [Brassica carinata]